MLLTQWWNEQADGSRQGTDTTQGRGDLAGTHFAAVVEAKESDNPLKPPPKPSQPGEITSS